MPRTTLAFAACACSFATTANDGHFGPAAAVRPGVRRRRTRGAGRRARVVRRGARARRVRPRAVRGRAARADRPGDGDACPTLPFEEADDAGHPRGVRPHRRPGRAARGHRDDRALASRRRAARVGRAGVAGRPPSAPGCRTCTSCIGMHEVVDRGSRPRSSPSRWRSSAGLAGLAAGQATRGARRTSRCSARCPLSLDHAVGEALRRGDVAAVPRARRGPDRRRDLPVWGDPDLPLVYVTFGSVTGSLPPLRRPLPRGARRPRRTSTPGC